MKFFMHLSGRLGNLLFQYCNARALCEQNGHTLCIPPWVGEKIFDIPMADRTPASQCDMREIDCMHQDQASLIYTRSQVKQWLRIRPEVLEKLSVITQNRKPVLLSVRKGRDFLGAGLVSLGLACYVEAAAQRGYGPEDCEWEIDTSPTRLPWFQGDVTAAGLGTTWVSLPAFYRIMTAKVLFRANSTFDFWAATLGDGEVYSPVIRGMTGGVPDQYCTNWVQGNWPSPSANTPNTDLHLAEHAKAC